MEGDKFEREERKEGMKKGQVRDKRRSEEIGTDREREGDREKDSKTE